MEGANKVEPMVTESASWGRSRDKNVDMLRAFTGSELYDCSFKVGIEPNCKVFKCHKVILSIVSSVFQAMLYGHFREACMSPDDPIVLEDTDPDTFDAAMRFIYGNQNSFKDVDLAKRVYMFADKMEIVSLSTAIVEYFEEHMDSSNVLGLIDIYKTTENNAALGKCIEVLLEDAEAALRADCWLGVSADTVEAVLQMDEMAIDEVDIFKALINWGMAQLKKGGIDDRDESLLRAKVGHFVKLIRFESLSAECAAEVIRSANVLSHKELGFALLASILSDVKCLPSEWGVEDKRPARMSYSCVNIEYTKGENRMIHEPPKSTLDSGKLSFPFSVTRSVVLVQFSLAPDVEMCGGPDKTIVLVEESLFYLTTRDRAKELTNFRLESNLTYKLNGERVILHPGKKYELRFQKVVERGFHCYAFKPILPLSRPDLMCNVFSTYIPVTSLHLKMVRSKVVNMDDMALSFLAFE